MNQVLIILTFLVGLVGLYFTYMIVNVVVTIIKSRCLEALKSGAK